MLVLRLAPVAGVKKNTTAALGPKTLEGKGLKRGAALGNNLGSTDEV